MRVRCFKNTDTMLIQFSDEHASMRTGHPRSGSYFVSRSFCTSSAVIEDGLAPKRAIT